MPRAFSEQEADEKLRKLEPMMASRAIIGPKLAAKFPHLAHNLDTPSASTSHRRTCTADADAVADIAGVDPADTSEQAQTTEVMSTSSSSHGLNIRENTQNNDSAAVFAEAVPPVAAVGAAPEATAAVALRKQRSKPSRIPKT